jgi:hypothetical protein
MRSKVARRDKGDHREEAIDEGQKEVAKGMRDRARKKGRQRWWVHEVKEVCSIYNQPKVKKSTFFSLVNLINLGILFKSALIWWDFVIRLFPSNLLNWTWCLLF